MIALLTFTAALILGFLAGYYSALTQMADKTEGNVDPLQALERAYRASSSLDRK